MNRWSKIVLGLTSIATAGWIAAGAYGFSVGDDATFARHTLLSFVALLAMILGHAWMATFAAISPPLIERRSGVGGPGFVQLRAARRITVAAAAVAIGAGLAQFVVSNALHPERMSRQAHLIGAAASVLILFAALLLEARALSRHGRAVAGLER